MFKIIKIQQGSSAYTIARLVLPVMALVASITWYVAWDPVNLVGLERTVVRLANHWFLFSLVAFLYVMAAGLIGTEMGIPSLFRADPDVGFRWKSPGLWGAFGATCLVCLVWTMVYWLYFIGGTAALKSKAEGLTEFDLQLMSPVYDVKAIPTEAKNRIIVADVQNSLHFRIFDAAGTRVADETQLKSDIDISQLNYILNRLWNKTQLPQSDKLRVVATVASIVDLWPSPFIPSHNPDDLQNPWSVLKFLGVCAPPFLLVLLLIGAWPAKAPGSTERPPRRVRLDVTEYGTGILLGILLVVFIVQIAWYASSALGHLDAIGCLLNVSDRWISTYHLRQHVIPLVIPFDPRLIRTINGAFWAFLGANVVAALLLLNMRRMTPSLAISLLFSVLAGFYFILSSLRPRWQLAFMVGAAIWVFWSNRGHYKYRIPGIVGRDGRCLYEWAAEKTRSPHNPRLSVLVGLYFAFVVSLLQPRRPWLWIIMPIAVLAVLWILWTCRNFLKLRIPGIDDPDNQSSNELSNPVRLTPRSIDFEPGSPLLKNEAVLDAWRVRLREDRPKLVLLAVTGGAYRASFWVASVLDELERRSAPNGKLEGLTDHIRMITGASGGMVAAAYFAALRDPVKPPPSIVEAIAADTGRDSLTPVAQQLVQRDIPLIFWPAYHQRIDRGTVLDSQWKTLAKTFASLREGEAAGWRPSLVISPMIVENGQRLLISNLDLSTLADPATRTGRPYERPAQEFFSLFPFAHATFHVNTAVRLNATFPYVSPAVSLPTTPPLRVVDAGYYDNYGVNLAATWAYLHRDWIKENKFDLSIIQVYAYARERPAGTDEHEKAPGEMTLEPGNRAFSWLTSPVEGGLAALNWSMLYRNEEQLRLLDDTFDNFETFVFANSGQTALNWFVTNDDISKMREHIEHPKSDIQRELERLEAWWKP